MEQWINLGLKLRTFVNPKTFPVAVKFLKDASQLPASSKRPSRDLGVRMAPCQGAAMARLYGWTVAFAKEDVGCAIAAHTYNWDRVVDEDGVITFLTKMNYAADETGAREIFDGFRLLEEGKELVVVYSPLERTKLEPHL